jgi:hypothetical protein
VDLTVPARRSLRWKRFLHLPTGRWGYRDLDTASKRALYDNLDKNEEPALAVNAAATCSVSQVRLLTRLNL